MNDIL